MTIKKQASDRFYNKLSSLARKQKFPLKAMFELTYRCNFHCLHCYVVPDKKKKELNTDQVKTMLDELKAAGCFHVGFTGGEPLLRKDIFDILNYARENGFRISLLTNGYLIDRKAARKIAALGTSLNRVDVSVLGATEDTFEAITRKKGSFEKVMRAIQLLKDEGVDVQSKATLMKPNQSEFLKIRELAEKFGTLFRYGTSLIPKVDGNPAPLQYLADPEEVYEIKTKLAKGKRTINEGNREGRNLKKPLFRCGAGRSEVSLSPYGEMNLCLEIHYPEYNILKGSFEEGWQKIKKIAEEASKKAEKSLCKNCALVPFCHFCPALEFFNGKFSGCSAYHREMALVEARHKRA